MNKSLAPVTVQHDATSLGFHLPYLQPNGVDEFLMIFIKQIDRVNTTFEKTSAGSTGFTYICRISADFYSGQDELIKKLFGLTFSTLTEFGSLEFVVKFINMDIGKAEQLCAKVLGSYQVLTPSIEFASAKVARKVLRIAQKSTPACKFDEKEDVLLFMPAFDAVTVHSAFLNGEFFLLPKLDFDKIAVAFGKIVIFDLLIGNDDRLVRWDVRIPGYLITPNFNSGNIMLSIPLENRCRKLENIYFIDNCSSRRLLDRKKEDESDLDYRGFFDEEEDNALVETSCNEKEESNFNEDIISASDFNKSTNYLIDNLDKLKKHVVESIKKELGNCNASIEKKDLFLLSLQTHLKIGFDEALEEITSREINELLSELECGISENPFLKKILELIRRNIHDIIERCSKLRASESNSSFFLEMTKEVREEAN